MKKHYKTQPMVAQPMVAQNPTITITTLKEMFAKHPFKDTAALPPIRVELQTRDDDNTTVEEEGWIRRPLGHGGVVGLMLYMSNPLFRSGTAATRRCFLREEVTDAQKRAQVKLRGRKWPAQRVSEAISNCLQWEKTVVGIRDYACSVICVLYDIQMIVVDTDTKTLQFFPEDVRTWRNDLPIYMMSGDGRWLFATQDNSEVWPARSFGMWLSKREETGWNVMWPLADGNMDALREIMENANVPIEGRIKKEDLAKKAGRTQAIHLFGSWSRSGLETESF